MKGNVIIFWLAVLFVIICFYFTCTIPASAEEFDITISKTFDIAPGASQAENEEVYKLDISKVIYSTGLTSNLDFQTEGYFSILENNDIFLGSGVRTLFIYSITPNFSVSTGIGTLWIVDGGEISGLADSYGYGTFEAYLKYHYFSIGYQHLSDPFSHAKEGDSGVNLFSGRFDIPLETIYKFIRDM